MEKNKVIEAMAKAIYIGRNGHLSYNQWRSYPRIKEAYTKDAEAALDVFLVSIPDIPPVIEDADGQIRDDYSVYELEKFYHQLLSWWRK